jgi:hypothetical protein
MRNYGCKFFARRINYLYNKKLCLFRDVCPYNATWGGGGKSTVHARCFWPTPGPLEILLAYISAIAEKEYGGMFEAFIESAIEAKEEARAEGMEAGQIKGLETAARNLLAKGAAIDYVHEITGLDIDTIMKLG